jgi:hypothetical protein
MRTNGTLQIETVSSGGVNEYGEPTSAVSSYSDAIACNIKTNSDNRIGKYEDGEFRIASFTILVELEDDVAEKILEAKRIKLTRFTESLGEYRVMNAELLPTVGRVQLTV